MNIKERQRNITDYINSCIFRLKEEVELVSYIQQNQNGFKKNEKIFLSLIDVYSRDIVLILNNILDQDKKTSSFFTLVQFIEDSETKSEYLHNLKNIKTSLNTVVRFRSNTAAHFNTEVNNDISKGLWHINCPVSLDCLYIQKNLTEIENFFWDIKEKLNIEGIFMSTIGMGITEEFKNLFLDRQN